MNYQLEIKKDARSFVPTLYEMVHVHTKQRATDSRIMTGFFVRALLLRLIIIFSPSSGHFFCPAEKDEDGKRSIAERIKAMREHDLMLFNSRCRSKLHTILPLNLNRFGPYNIANYTFSTSLLFL